MTTPDLQVIEALLSHPSQMGDRMRSFDWESTPVGAPSTWPQTLRVALGICLNSEFPMFVRWGEELTQFYNDAYIPLLGQKHPWALGQSAREIWAEVWPVLEGQINAVMQHGQASWNERVPLKLRRNGFDEDAWMTWSYSPIPDGNGGIGGVFCACTEETQNVLAALERDVLAEQRRLALRSAQLGWWQLDLQTQDVIWDDRFRAIFGVQNDRQSFDEIMETIHVEDRARVRAAVQLATDADHPQPYSIEARVVHADGSYRWVYSRGEVHEGPGGRGLSLVGTVSDITERKTAEEERAVLLENERRARQQADATNRIKDEFLSTLSHELRTPLQAILGWSHLLRSGRLSEDEGKRAIETIDRNARAQVQLVEDLLDVSRIITGKLRLEVQPVELPEVIRMAVDAVRPAAHAKDIRLQVLLDPDAGPISGDANRLQQVVWNLLSNAVKFTPKGGRVQVRLERVNSHVEITVTDTGLGITPDFLPFIFDRFRQADQTSTREHGGLGLGLSIVHQLVELHGGSIQVSSPGPNLGATFVVNLPQLSIRPSKAESTPEERRHPTSEGFSFEGEEAFDCPPQLGHVRVLLVDDEADSRAILQLVLEGCNAVVTTAASVDEAFALFKDSPPDILISDIGMPGQDGYSLIKRVRSWESGSGQRVPAVALTAYARIEDRVRALRSGFQVHVPKPVEPQELIAVVMSLVREHRPNYLGGSADEF